MAIGPSAELRHVVGLDAPVFRLARGAATRLGGPGAGWAAFDDRHREVRRGSGRFLAGWDRWLVLEEHGRLCREDLVAGSRQELGAVGRAVLAAAAIPGSPSAVLFSLEDGGLVRIV